MCLLAKLLGKDCDKGLAHLPTLETLNLKLSPNFRPPPNTCDLSAGQLPGGYLLLWASYGETKGYGRGMKACMGQSTHLEISS